MGLPEKDFLILKKSLPFLHVKEMKQLAQKLLLSDKGKKMELIQRVLIYVSTGEKIILKKFPKNSYAQKGEVKVLSPDQLILKGSYKNDLKNRLFFKSLIGEHFHFTAFGIDWINEQWMNGTPPTYQEFADMWQTETLRRSKDPSAPKEEWAYINFVQDLLQKDPQQSRESMLLAWKTERLKNKENINKIINSYIKNNT